MFCPKCGSLMLPVDGNFKCNYCGLVVHAQESKIMTKKAEKKEVAVFETDVEVLPKTRIECPECGNMEAYWIIRQTRAADEPETRIYKCTACGHKWREY